MNPEIPAGLEQVILKALEKDKGRRHQKASGLKADLERLREEARALASGCGEGSRPEAGHRGVGGPSLSQRW